MSIERVEQAALVEFFAAPSLLPVASKCSFEIRRLACRAHFELSTRTLRWEKTYLLTKVRSAHPGNDQWFEVTGCPAGRMVSAMSDGRGLAWSTSHDMRGNLVHRIELGAEFRVASNVDVALVFEVMQLEKEDKLLDVGSGYFLHRSVFLRLEQGYSVKCGELVMAVHAEGGRISGAWPRALFAPKGESDAEFRKTDLRPYEVVTPFVHIERGSRRRALVVQGLATFLLGICASLVAALIYEQRG